MKRKSKFLIFAIIFVLISTNLFAEKWVGQANTYQLKTGVRMADGTPFDRNKAAAACNCFKIGSKIKVINTKNGKSAEVTVTDRINNESNYFILLTPKAASAIDAEWESVIVIVQANFGDINSEDVFKVNGLVPENQIDPDSLREFPDIDWPNADETEEDETDEDDIPDFVKELLAEEDDDYEDIPFDTEYEDTEDDYASDSQPEVEEPQPEPEAEPEPLIEPQEEQTEPDIPRQANVVAVMDNEAEIEPEHEDPIEPQEPIYPAQETIPTPTPKSPIVEVMEDSRINPSRPKSDSEAIPQSVQKTTFSDEDEADIEKCYPAEDKGRKPVWNKWLINSDEICGENYIIRPVEDQTADVSADTILLSEDDEEVTVNLDEPKIEDNSAPDMTSDLISEDDIAAPAYNHDAVPAEWQDLISQDDEDLPQECTDDTPTEWEDIINVDDAELPQECTDDTPTEWQDIISEDDGELPQDQTDDTPIEYEDDISNDESDDTDTRTPDLEYQEPPVEESEIDDGDFTEVYAEPEPFSEEESNDDEMIDVEPLEFNDISETEPAEDEFEWVTSLEPNKIYVRFLTTFDKSEARRMANNFKSIIGRITVYKTDDKFILLCGPYNSDSDEAFRALSDLKSMGFADAYLISE